MRAARGLCEPPVSVGSVVTVALPYSNQSPHFIECFHGGKKTWFGKSALMAYQVDHAMKNVVLTMATAYAKKRGLI